MPEHSISNFQVITTRQRDHGAPRGHKSLDTLISGVEAQYDRARMRSLIAALEQHILNDTPDAHDNLSFSEAEFISVLYVRLLAEYNAITDSDLSNGSFVAAVSDRPQIILELLRRIYLNEIDFVDESGGVPDETNYYTSDIVKELSVSRKFNATVLTAATAKGLLGVALSGDAHYDPSDMHNVPLASAGALLVTVRHPFPATEAEDLPLLSLTGSDIEINIACSPNADDVFTIESGLNGDAVDTTTITSNAYVAERNILITFDHTEIAAHMFDTHGDVITEVCQSYVQTLHPTALTVHQEIMPDGDSSGSAKMVSVAVINGTIRPHEIDGLLGTGI